MREKQEITSTLQSHLLDTSPPFQIKPARILHHLSRSKILVEYLRGAIVDEQIETWKNSPEFKSIEFDPNIPTINSPAILFNLYKQNKFGRFVRSRFLVRKSQLDRVLFSTIQVKDFQLAQELYCRITEQNQSFTRLAIAHSNGTTAKRGGSTGPIPTIQLYPQIQHYLTGLQHHQLSPIFNLDGDYIFLRLDRWLPVQLTPQIEQQLLDEIFEEWLQHKIIDRIGNTRTVISSPIVSTIDRLNLNSGELASSGDTEPDPTDTIAATSSFFFPKVSASGKILPSHLPARQPANSSFFPPQQLPRHPLPARQQYRRHNSIAQIFVFTIFFCVFLGGGIAVVKFFSSPVVPATSID